jgi:hypothetical protein
MPCSHWSLRPVWKFNSSISAAKTSHPILFLSNSLDPVTPLRNAKKMSKQFPGSVVFGQDAEGHCTLAAPSVCIAKGIRDYFNTGELPKEGMACKPDRSIFDYWSIQENSVSTADLHIFKATRLLAEMFTKRVHPLSL